jgi:hypothetical protein
MSLLGRGVLRPSSPARLATSSHPAPEERGWIDGFTSVML